jgi:hypothetical protein
MEVVMSTTVDTAVDIRPFTVEIPEENLAELRRRIEPALGTCDRRSDPGDLVERRMLAHRRPLTTPR